MRVARYRTTGSPEHIEIAEQPEPAPVEGHISVAVRASSVNPIDWKIASGAFPFNIMKPSLPYIPGHDVAGVVTHAAGPFQKGDRVFARIPGRSGGALAEHVHFDHSAAAKIPDSMTDHEAGAIPLAALTALQGLRDEAMLPMQSAENYRVLVVGASGGVGHFGVQIARAAGAHVTAVCSGRNAQWVTELGAHTVIDYAKTTVFNEGGNYDVILDCVGSDSVGRFTPWLKPEGVYASTLPNLSIFSRQLAYSLIGRKRVRAVIVKPIGDDLRFLNTLYAKGIFRVVIDEVFPLERTADAHRKSIEGRARGKIVVSMV
jgi:chloroplastic oxoene reductase